MEAQSPQTAADRRKHPRHFIRILVDYTASDSFLYDYSNDLSEGGLFIQTASPLPVGATLELRFTVPGVDRLFRLQGEVMWLNSEVQPEADTVEEDGLNDLLAAATSVAAETKEPPLPPGMGVRFTNITPEEQAILRDFLQKETY